MASYAVMYNILKAESVPPLKLFFDLPDLEVRGDKKHTVAYQEDRVIT